MSATRSPDESPSAAVAQPVDPGDKPNREPDLFADVLSRLVGGPFVFGGIGWGLDHWLATSLFLPIGAIVGMALSLYVVWLRYGTQ